MISTRIAASRSLGKVMRPTASRMAAVRVPSQQLRSASSYPDIEDPEMNGGYVNPPRINRQNRDPHADWWDKQERRNYGEPVHEDNDILGMFSLEEYKHVTPGVALLQLGCFITAVFGLVGLVSLYYPDKPSAPRTFPGGLDYELGGPRAVKALSDGDFDKDARVAEEVD